jgi:hypothetical protein
MRRIGKKPVTGGLTAGLDASKFNARGQSILADMRASGSSVTAMAVPKISDIARLLTGGRKGVPRHVSPVKPPAMTSMVPNIVGQSQAGQTIGAAARRAINKPARSRGAIPPARAVRRSGSAVRTK